MRRLGDCKVMLAFQRRRLGAGQLGAGHLNACNQGTGSWYRTFRRRSFGHQRLALAILIFFYKVVDQNIAIFSWIFTWFADLVHLNGTSLAGFPI